MIDKRAFALFVVAYSAFGADSAIPQAMAPHHVEAAVTHFRIIAVVPMVGTGKQGDPFRPAYVPLPPSGMLPASPDGILGYSVQLSDDRKHALVEFVARNPAAFKQIMADKSPDVKVFIRGASTRAEIETYFRQYKKDANLDLIGVVLP